MARVTGEAGWASGRRTSREGRAEEPRRERGGAGEGLWSPSVPPHGDRRGGVLGKWPRLCTGFREWVGAGVAGPPVARRPARTQAPGCVRRPARTASGAFVGAFVRGVGACSWRVAVRPAVRSGPVPAAALAWVLRGSARCTGHGGLGEHRRLIPRRRRTGPGGGLRLPDLAWSRCGTRCPCGSQGDCLALAGLGRGVAQALRQHGAYRYECVHSWPRCAGRSVPAPPEIGRMSPVGRGWADGFADIPTAFPVGCRPWPDPGRYVWTSAGTQRAESAPPLRSGPTRAGRPRNVRSGSRSPAFARGACARDVRRP